MNLTTSARFFAIFLPISNTVVAEVHRSSTVGWPLFVPNSPFALMNKSSSSLHQLSEKSDKAIFLDSLDEKDTLNAATKTRTNLLQKMIDNKTSVSSVEDLIPENSSSSKSLEKPGLQETFNRVSEGNWKVIYAPHMTTISGLFGGRFDVQYIMHKNNEMTSHARYDFPVVGEGYLSVSGTYSSVDENISRVDFDKAWVKSLLVNNQEEDDEKKKPYRSLNEVPNGPIKDLINRVGQTFFIEQFSVFPISFLDEDIIVFDFPLLGTRICALKQ